MPEQLTLVAKYYAYSEFKIPLDIKKEDIKNYLIRWGKLYLTLKNGKTLEIESRCEVVETLNIKEPREDWFEMIDYSSDEEEDEDGVDGGPAPERQVGTELHPRPEGSRGGGGQGPDKNAVQSTTSRHFQHHQELLPEADEEDRAVQGAGSDPLDLGPEDGRLSLPASAVQQYQPGGPVYHGCE